MTRLTSSGFSAKTAKALNSQQLPKIPWMQKEVIMAQMQEGIKALNSQQLPKIPWM